MKDKGKPPYVRAVEALGWTGCAGQTFDGWEGCPPRSTTREKVPRIDCDEKALDRMLGERGLRINISPGKDAFEASMRGDEAVPAGLGRTRLMAVCNLLINWNEARLARS